MPPTGKEQQPVPLAVCGAGSCSRRLRGGYSLVEVVVAAAITAMVFGTILTGYVQSGLRAQWSGYSLAAQSLATEQLEQTRSAMWDPAMGTNQITNLNLTAWSYTASNQTWSGYITNILDVPYSSTNYVIATNFVSAQLINLNNDTNIPTQVYFIKVTTVWPFRYRKFNTVCTNSVATYLAPDNRDVSGL